MANPIIPQTDQFCKVYLNSKTDAIAARYSKRSEKPYQECAYILSMGNDAAVEFFKSIGCDQVIPGTHFVPMNDIAYLYGVKEDSFCGYIHRHGFSRSDNPKEAISCTISSFFRRAGLLRSAKFWLMQRSKFPQLSQSLHNSFCGRHFQPPIFNSTPVAAVHEIVVSKI